MNDDLIDDELSPRERRHQRTHRAILQATRAIIAEEGIDKLSIRAIADRIDYSPAGLYEYFGSKEEIVGAVCWEGHRALKRAMARIDTNLDPADYLVEIGMVYIDFAVQNPDYFVLMFTNASSSPNTENNIENSVESKVANKVQKSLPAQMLGEASSFPLLLAGIDRAVQQGAIHMLPDKGSRETAYALWALVHGAAMLRITHLKAYQADFDSTHRQMLRAFVRGLGR